MENKTMTQAKHTPTPWINHQITNNGRSQNVICYGDNPIAKCMGGFVDSAEANAAFIVKAVNSHEALVEAILKLRDAFYVNGTSKALKKAFEETHSLVKELRAEGK